MASFDVKMTTSPKIMVAYTEHRGAYVGVADAMQSLKAWIDSRGIEQAGYPFCLFYDNPSEKPEAELRSEACIPVSEAFEPGERFKIKELPESMVAETRHSGHPEEFSKTYGPFLEGLLKAGFSLLGPAREYYMTVAEAKGPGFGFLIQQPVQK